MAATSSSSVARRATARASPSTRRCARTCRTNYKFIGQTPFQPTNWDPTLTQQLLTADIAKYPKIDVIVSDFGPTLVSSLPLFAKSGRPIPALATSDGNSLSCFWQDSQATSPFKMVTVATGNDNVRLAVQYAVARATGGRIPTADSYKGPVFEDSVSPSSRTAFSAARTCPVTPTCPLRCPASSRRRSVNDSMNDRRQPSGPARDQKRTMKSTPGGDPMTE